MLMCVVHHSLDIVCNRRALKLKEVLSVSAFEHMLLNHYLARKQAKFVTFWRYLSAKDRQVQRKDR